MAEKRKRKMMNTTSAERALQQIALREGTSVQTVRQHMQAAMLSAMLSDDPKVKAFWEQLPRKGEIVTPEELITFLAAKLHAD